MKIRLPFFFFIFLLTGFLTAQETPQVIFSEDFNGGLNTFTHGAGSPVGAVWQWRSNGKPDSALVNGVMTPAWTGIRTLPAIASKTPENGAAVFNSDVYDSGGIDLGAGAYEAPQTDTLTSPVIDCSSNDGVFLTFHHWMLALADDNIRLQVTGDAGATWEDISLLDGIQEDDGLYFTFRDQFETVDVTAYAANNPAFQFRFIWNDGYYYFWMIDDVELIEKPSNDLKLGNFFYAPASYAQPVSQIGTDTMAFEALVSNIGNTDQTNVVLRATIFDAGDNIIFRDSVLIDVLPAGYQDSLLRIDTVFVPNQLATGDYRLSYFTYTRDSEDFNIFDNSESRDFLVTENLFSKELAISTAIQPSGGGDFSIGNLYRMSPAAGAEGKQYFASKAYFACASNNDFNNETVTILLYKINDAVTGDFANFDVNSVGNNDDVEIVGFGAVTLTSAQSNFEVLEVDLFDFDSNPGVQLDAGSQYFLMATYEGSANQLFHAVSRSIDYYQISTVLNLDGQWLLGGFGPEDAAVLRMEIDFTESTRNEELISQLNARLYPNPTQDIFRVDFSSFEKAQNTIFNLFNAQGSLIEQRRVDNYLGEMQSFDLSNYPQGQYFMNIAMEDGTSIGQRVVIQR